MSEYLISTINREIHLKRQTRHKTPSFTLLCFLSLLHHLLHFRELLDEAVDVLDTSTAAFSNTALAAVLDQHFRVGTRPFLSRHGCDDGFDSLEFLAVHVDLVEFFLVLPDAGNEAQEAAHVTHLLNHLKLREEIIEGERPALHGLLHVFHGLFVKSSLGFFDNRFDVA